jgi:hypothetical protein
MIGNIRTLDAIRVHCLRGKPLTSDLRIWLAEALDRYLKQECENLNDAFGVRQGRGGIPWWRERAIRERDAALRELSREFFAGLPVGSHARAITQLAYRYASTCWPRDREHDTMPLHYHGTPKELLWRAFRSRAKMPVTERHLRNLLGS